MLPNTRILLSLSVVLAIPSLARAEPMPTATKQSPLADYTVGVRVGGYGFRDQTSTERRNAWDDCRMNGLGVFADRMLSKHLFVEAGFDFYFSESFPMEQKPGENMDRLSGLLTVAGGLRVFPESRVSGYVQIGLGVEASRIKILDEHNPLTRSMVSPIGFVGFGGDIRVGEHLRLGANLRTHYMHHPMPGHNGGSQMQTEPTGEVATEREIAAQGQFYAKYSF